VALKYCWMNTAFNSTRGRAWCALEWILKHPLENPWVICSAVHVFFAWRTRGFDSVSSFFDTSGCSSGTFDILYKSSMPTYQTSRQSEDLPSQQQQSIASSFGAFATTHYKNYRIPLLVVFVLLVACIVVLAALFDDPWTVRKLCFKRISCFSQE